MPQIIEVPGYGQVEFPDGMSDDQIVGAIKSNMQQPNQGIRNPVMDSRKASTERAKSTQYGNARTHEARMANDPYYRTAQESSFAENALAGIGGVFKGLGYTGPRQIIGIDKPGEYEEWKSSMEGLNSTGAGKFGSFLGYGLPAAATAPITGAAALPAAVVAGAESFLDPADSGEQRAWKTGLGAVAGGVGQKFANVLGNASTNARAARQLRSYPGSATVRDKTLTDTLDLGYKLPPSAAGKQSTLEGVSGQIKTQQAMSDFNQNITDSLIRKELADAGRFGYQVTPTTPLVSDTMRTIRKSAARPYEQIKELGSIPVGPAKQVTSYVDAAGNKVKLPKQPVAPKTRNVLAEIKRAGGLSADDLPNYGLTSKDANKLYPGLFRKDGGMKPDDLTEWMGQNEWVFQKYIDEADSNLTGGGHELSRDIVSTALGKERVTHPQDFDAVYSYDDARKNYEATVKDYKRVDKTVQKKIDTNKTIEQLKQLRHDGYSNLSAARLSGDPAALKQARKMLDEAGEIEKRLEEGLQNVGRADILDDLKAARKLIAKTYNVQDSIRESVGRVDARDLGALYELGEKGYGPKLTGSLADVGKAGSAFRESMGMRGFESPRYSALDAAVSGMNIANAHNPVGVLAGGLPLLRGAARDKLMSQAAQAKLRPNYAPPGSLMRAMPWLFDYTPNVPGIGPYPFSRIVPPSLLTGGLLVDSAE